MIYLDYQATTPLAPEVRDAMLPWLSDRFGNPHSPHRMGREAAAAVAYAGDRLTAALDLPPGRVVFTSGATEAVNWTIQSALRHAPRGRRAIVTIATEHACVLDTAAAMAAEGYEARVLPVGRDGLVDLDMAAGAIRDDVALVAAMLVNNEIGILQPIAALADLAHAAGARFLCDAVQGLGRVAIPPACDFVAVSAHKLHGPKGVGALWLREGATLAPLIHGGGQQDGLRSGTLSPALCVGFGAAASLASERTTIDARHVEGLWDAAVAAFGDGWTINGAIERRYRGNLNIRREGLDVARLMSELRDVAFSAGSACASGSGRPSHVLRALGLSEAAAKSSIRLGFGRYTTEEQLVEAATRIDAAAARQREWA
ncbi:cysteine desulfurase family protein [Sphingomonas bacterium]|uniref:cysteine desulfurase family protein n=1 Tax=Sphingomonas bacterium TaxID=1895847 RepID=UPI001575BC32|nr:cysteine desulfurase family protein [Sphingomonas bacterium]